MGVLCCFSYLKQIFMHTPFFWQVVNLKEARDFSSNKDFIYVFKVTMLPSIFLWFRTLCDINYGSLEQPFLWYLSGCPCLIIILQSPVCGISLFLPVVAIVWPLIISCSGFWIIDWSFKNFHDSCSLFCQKLEWGSLSIDLLPHPDMFMDARVQEGASKRDDDGANRLFFGGERFLEGISGQAYVSCHLSFE